METLLRELEAYKKSLSEEEKQQLSDTVLDKLYTVYPFNKFESVKKYKTIRFLVINTELRNIQNRVLS